MSLFQQLHLDMPGKLQRQKVCPDFAMRKMRGQNVTGLAHGLSAKNAIMNCTFARN